MAQEKKTPRSDNSSFTQKPPASASNRKTPTAKTPLVPAPLSASKVQVLVRNSSRPDPASTARETARRSTHAQRLALRSLPPLPAPSVLRLTISLSLVVSASFDPITCTPRPYLVSRRQFLLPFPDPSLATIADLKETAFRAWCEIELEEEGRVIDRSLVRQTKIRNKDNSSIPSHVLVGHAFEEREWVQYVVVIDAGDRNAFLESTEGKQSGLAVEAAPETRKRRRESDASPGPEREEARADVATDDEVSSHWQRRGKRPRIVNDELEVEGSVPAATAASAGSRLELRRNHKPAWEDEDKDEEAASDVGVVSWGHDEDSLMETVEEAVDNREESSEGEDEVEEEDGEDEDEGDDDDVKDYVEDSDEDARASNGFLDLEAEEASVDEPDERVDSEVEEASGDESDETDDEEVAEAAGVESDERVDAEVEEASGDESDESDDEEVAEAAGDESDERVGAEVEEASGDESEETEDEESSEAAGDESDEKVSAEVEEASGDESDETEDEEEDSLEERPEVATGSIAPSTHSDEEENIDEESARLRESLLPDGGASDDDSDSDDAGAESKDPQVDEMDEDDESGGGEGDSGFDEIERPSSAAVSPTDLTTRLHAFQVRASSTSATSDDDEDDGAGETQKAAAKDGGAETDYASESDDDEEVPATQSRPKPPQPQVVAPLGISAAAAILRASPEADAVAREESDAESEPTSPASPKADAVTRDESDADSDMTTDDPIAMAPAAPKVSSPQTTAPAHSAASPRISRTKPRQQDPGRSPFTVKTPPPLRQSPERTGMSDSEEVLTLTQRQYPFTQVPYNRLSTAPLIHDKEDCSSSQSSEVSQSVFTASISDGPLSKRPASQPLQSKTFHPPPRPTSSSQTQLLAPPRLSSYSSLSEIAAASFGRRGAFGGLRWSQTSIEADQTQASAKPVATSESEDDLVPEGSSSESESDVSSDNSEEEAPKIRLAGRNLKKRKRSALLNLARDVAPIRPPTPDPVARPKLSRPTRKPSNTRPPPPIKVPSAPILQSIPKPTPTPIASASLGVIGGRFGSRQPTLEEIAMEIDGKDDDSE
ncbi:hypothetical protein BDK51DRAFT_25882 [Blyttiomyces helicus]|uniref:Uncharacterized protein n=1 Tax=Blyttiomyces helicus TaxID=388810 RepID=A0A4P9WFS5_9FUNG|nr:hypothetical protein BDK51DRAFT_25882 [Blyttiomyces helicus]|eukprot:RKO90725.1 hypothetical protein BDK51DRAFT_25882 [Blyttiomyces helicus]